MKTTINVPLIFIHRGYSDYMEYSLRQARSVVPEDVEIILLGDASNNRFDFVTHVDMMKYQEEFDNFLKIYKHCSTNNYQYESFCLIRWLVLYRYLSDRGLDKCMVIDTDGMIYAYPQELFADFYANYDFCGIRHFNGRRSAGQGLWKTDNLKLFRDYIYLFFQDVNIYNQAVKKHKAISDMTVFADFLDCCPLKRFFNIIKKYQGMTTDSSIISSNSDRFCNDYQMTRPFHYFKKIKWQNGVPIALRRLSKDQVILYLLHFQGASKYAMAKFYRGPKFAGKFLLDFKFWGANIVAQFYGLWISPMRYKLKMIYLSRKRI